MKNFYISILLIFSFINVFSQNIRWDSQFNAINAPDDSVFAVSVLGNNIYVGGAFNNVALGSANHIVQYNGSSWIPMGSGFNGNVYAIVSFDTMIVAGGNFTTAGGLPASNLAYWNGTVWTSIGTGCNGTIRALEIYDQYLYVGGDFTSIGGISANHIARYDGTTWEAIGTGTDGPVYVIHHGSFLFAGGNFANAGGVPASNIASWNGTIWSAIGDGFDGQVNTMLGSGTAITAAGSFVNSGTNTVNNIAKWNGVSWISFSTGTNDTVYSIKQIGNSVFAIGSFTMAGAVSVNNIAEWDGTSWLTLGNGLNNKGYSLFSSGNDLICGGVFNSAGTNPSYYFGRYYSPPVINNQPVNYTKCQGDTLLLNVNISSSLPVTFQWEKDGFPIGTNNDTLLFSSAISADAGVYTCLISSSVGSALTLPIPVVINSEPTFLSVITDSSSCVGENINLSASIAGTLPITFQWYKNSLILAGENNDTLSITTLSVSNNGNYFCIAQNSCGIDTTNTFVLTINTLPVSSFSGLASEYCINGETDTLIGVPAGGIFSGNGISGNIFSPIGLVGNHSITYSYTDLNGCVGVSSLSTNVNTLTFVNFSGLDAFYCFNSDPDTLIAIPTGGNFSGAGMNGEIFSASTVSNGNNIVYYSYTDLNGCTNIKSQSTFIYSETIFTYTAIDSSFCENDNSDIINVYPFGGFFTGTGMTDSTFVPQNAGIGSHQIVYHYTDSHGCLNLDSLNFSVNSLPNVIITDISTEYCKNAIPDLLEGSPSGGIFTGSGISNNILDPQLLSPGSYDAYYTYVDSFGCSNADTATFTIVNAINVIFSGIYTFYCPYDSPEVLTGIPTGGVFSGPGVVGNTFSPSLAGSGIQTVVYTYDNLNGCFSYDSVDVTIDNLPNIQILPINDICFGETITLSAIGDTGTYLWNTLDTTVNISVSPAITTNYSVVLYGLTCINSDTVTVNVNPLPILNLGPDTSGCAPYIINAPGNLASYIWSNGGIDSLTTITQSGNYSLTVTNSYNCQATDNIFITVAPIPYFDLGQDLSISNTQTIIIGTTPSFDSYLWSTGSTQNFIIVNGQTAGFGLHTYSLTAYNNSGCSYTDSVIVNITNLGVNENIENEEISFFPNPSSDYITINVPDNNKLSGITITSEIGKKVFEINKAEIKKNKIKVDLSYFVKGVYFINFISENKFKTLKLLVN